MRCEVDAYHSVAIVAASSGNPKQAPKGENGKAADMHRKPERSNTGWYSICRKPGMCGACVEMVLRKESLYLYKKVSSAPGALALQRIQRTNRNRRALVLEGPLPWRCQLDKSLDRSSELTTGASHSTVVPRKRMSALSGSAVSCLEVAPVPKRGLVARWFIL